MMEKENKLFSAYTFAPNKYNLLSSIDKIKNMTSSRKEIVLSENLSSDQDISSKTSKSVSSASTSNDDFKTDFQESKLEKKLKNSQNKKRTESFICVICRSDLTDLDLNNRALHMNQCIDATSTSSSETNALVSETFILDCPLCFKNFSSPELRAHHIKKCGRSKGLTMQSILQALQLQEKHVLERKALGLPVNKIKQPKQPKKAVSKKFSVEPKSKMQSDLQLAKALSLSLKNDENSTPPSLISDNAFSLKTLKAPTESQSPGKSTCNKKIKLSHTPLLISRTEEERNKIILDKVNSIMLGQSETPTLSESKTIACDQIETKKVSVLWDLSGKAENKTTYYVEQLTDWIIPSEIDAGSKLCNLSQIPGHHIYTQLPLDYTFSSNDENKDSETPSESIQSSSLVSCLQTLIGNHWMSDVNIHTASGIVIPAHKLLLGVRCPALKKLFDTSITHERHILDWQNTSFDAALHFLNFIYTGSTEWKEEITEELTDLAQKYEVKDLLNILESDCGTLELMSIENTQINSDITEDDKIHHINSFSPSDCLNNKVNPVGDLEIAVQSDSQPSNISCCNEKLSKLRSYITQNKTQETLAVCDDIISCIKSDIPSSKMCDDISKDNQNCENVVEKKHSSLPEVYDIGSSSNDSSDNNKNNLVVKENSMCDSLINLPRINVIPEDEDIIIMETDYISCKKEVENCHNSYLSNISFHNSTPTKHISVNYGDGSNSQSDDHRKSYSNVLDNEDVVPMETEYCSNRNEEENYHISSSPDISFLSSTPAKKTLISLTPIKNLGDKTIGNGDIIQNSSCNSNSQSESPFKSPSNKKSNYARNSCEFSKTVEASVNNSPKSEDQICPNSSLSPIKDYPEENEVSLNERSFWEKSACSSGFIHNYNCVEDYSFENYDVDAFMNRNLTSPEIITCDSDEEAESAEHGFCLSQKSGSPVKHHENSSDSQEVKIVTKNTSINSNGENIISEYASFKDNNLSRQSFSNLIENSDSYLDNQINHSLLDFPGKTFPSSCKKKVSLASDTIPEVIIFESDEEDSNEFNSSNVSLNKNLGSHNLDDAIHNSSDNLDKQSSSSPSKSSLKSLNISSKLSITNNSSNEDIQAPEVISFDSDEENMPNEKLLLSSDEETDEMNKTLPLTKLPCSPDQKEDIKDLNLIIPDTDCKRSSSNSKSPNLSELISSSSILNIEREANYKKKEYRELQTLSPDSPWVIKAKKSLEDFQSSKSLSKAFEKCSNAENFSDKISVAAKTKEKNLLLSTQNEKKKKNTNHNISTPNSALQQFKLSDSPITPFPDYKNMHTPEIKEALKKIGVKALPKKKAVAVLSHIYEETHPWTGNVDHIENAVPNTDCTSNLEKQKKSKPKVPSQKRKRATETSNDKIKSSSQTVTASPTKTSSQNNSFSSPESKNAKKDVHNLSFSSDFSDHNQPEEEDKVQLVSDYIMKNDQLYTQILKYLPLNLALFQEELKENGIKISMKKLMDYLDEQCITFTQPRKEEYKKKQQIRTQRFRKRMIAKLSQQAQSNA